MQIYTNVVVAGANGQVPVKALVDTGAEMSMIPSHVAHSVAAWVTGQTRSVTGIDNDPREYPVVLATLTFSDLNSVGGGFPFVMSDVFRDVLVGMDIMNSLSISVDTGTGFLRVRNEVQESLKTLLSFVGTASLVFLGLKAWASLDDVAHCVRCGHVWEPRVENPAKCPRCGSYAWKG